MGESFPSVRGRVEYIKCQFRLSMDSLHEFFPSHLSKYIKMAVESRDDRKIDFIILIDYTITNWKMIAFPVVNRLESDASGIFKKLCGQNEFVSYFCSKKHYVK